MPAKDTSTENETSLCQRFTIIVQELYEEIYNRAVKGNA